MTQTTLDNRPAFAATRSLADALIRLEDIHAWYGESHILRGVDISMAKGELVCLLGRNGAGRTTTLKTIMGLVGRRTGQLQIKGRNTIDQEPHHIARLGLGYCPEERGIFSSLSCEENLLLLPRLGPKGMSVEQIYELFPNLLARRTAMGGQLSGGEQQMLAVARILRTGADVLLLDEISEGLAPVIVNTLGVVISKLRQLGFTILMVEQNYHFAAPLADYFYVMENGRVIGHFPAAELDTHKDFINSSLGV